ncbi:MAG: hypothetical protein IJP14_01485 [Clostridia bacterium]|nr:hypothetical protein [Clostridia bacterium]
MAIMRKWKDRITQRKVNTATRLFLKGNYEKAKRLLENVEYRRSGDAAAMTALMTAANDTLDQARKTYHDLWQAKNSCLINADLAAAVDTALDGVTPLVLEHAEEDIRKLHTYFTDGDKVSLFAACEEHVAYGHPDAIALQIAGYLQFGFESDAPSDPYHYDHHLESLRGNWFYDLARATRKGFSPAIAPLAEQSLQHLRLLGADGIITEPVPNWPDDPIDHPLWWE